MNSKISIDYEYGYITLSMTLDCKNHNTFMKRFETLCHWKQGNEYTWFNMMLDTVVRKEIESGNNIDKSMYKNNGYIRIRLTKCGKFESLFVDAYKD